MLALQYYHQTALIALADSDSIVEKSEWELGAYLLTKQLRDNSDILLSALYQTHQKEPTIC